MKIRVNKHKLNIHYIEVLSEEVELSNTRTAYVMHIPSPLSLTSARNNRKQKLQKLFFGQLHFNNVTSHAFFFTEAILLCAVRDAQCKTRESP